MIFCMGRLLGDSFFLERIFGDRVEAPMVSEAPGAAQTPTSMISDGSHDYINTTSGLVIIIHLRSYV